MVLLGPHTTSTPGEAHSAEPGVLSCVDGVDSAVLLPHAPKAPLGRSAVSAITKRKAVQEHDAPVAALGATGRSAWCEGGEAVRCVGR